MAVVKVLELVGESTSGWQEAASNAIAEASRTVDNIVACEIINWTANVSEGEIKEYKANVKVAYVGDEGLR
ncbi:MAG: dodecin family protein [Ignavibacteriales bacterium]